MTDYTKLVDRLCEIASVQGFPTDDLVDAADAIEALQAENERLTRQWAEWSDSLDSVMKQRNALQAKLDVLQTQEPVAVVDANDDGYWADILPDRDVKVGQQLFAAPKAPTPEQVEEAWRAGWAACRDAEYVGQEAEDEAWGMSQTCANADWENAAPKALEPESIQWIVNDLGELGVKAGNRFMFLYKGDSIEYGKDDIGTAKHSDGTPMKYRIVGKREFGEVCYPLKWIANNRSEPRYTEELVFMPGLSFGTPEDGEWRELPAAHGITKGTP